jgi:hypothetical protein
MRLYSFKAEFGKSRENACCQKAIRRERKKVRDDFRPRAWSKRVLTERTLVKTYIIMQAFPSSAAAMHALIGN